MSPFNRQFAPGVMATAAVCLLLTGCRGTPQEREAARMARGNAYVQKKEYKKAAIEFKVASQNAPTDAEPVYRLGMAYLNGGALRQAVEAFQKAITLNPKHEGARYQMALFSVGSNKPETVQDARQVLSAYLVAHPESAEAMGSLALAEAKLGNKAESLQMLQRAMDKDPSNRRPALMVVAVYAAKGDVDSAKEIASDLTSRHPNSPDAAVLRAQVSLAAGNMPDADAEIGRALALKRDFRPALELRLRRELTTGNSSGAEETTRELAQLPEKRVWAAYARMLFAEKRYVEGIAEFNRVLKEHGDDNEIRDEYSGLLMSTGHRKEAEAILAATLTKNPKDKQGLLQRLTLEVDRGNLDDAAKDVLTLQGLKAFSAQLSYQRSRILGARGETVQQGDALAEALQMNPRFLIARLELARILMSAGRSKDALTILAQAAPAEQNTPEYIFYRNMALMAAGDWDEARKSVDQALAISKSPRFLYQDAALKVRRNDLAGARKSLDAGFQLAPTDPLTFGLLGDVMRKQGETVKYAALLKEAAAKNPGSAVLANALGKQLVALGDSAGARAAFEGARAAGDIVDADIEIALLDLQTGALDAARQRLLDLAKTHDNARARMILAEIETKKGSAADVVIQHYLKALQLEPANVLAMNNLADVLSSRQNKFDDALFWAQKALALTPNNPIVEDTIGWIYYREGKYDAALPYLEKSAKDLDRPLAHYHLAGVLVRAGDPSRGRREYELALKQDPRSDARAAVDPLFTGKK